MTFKPICKNNNKIGETCFDTHINVNVEWEKCGQVDLFLISCGFGGYLNE